MTDLIERSEIFPALQSAGVPYNYATQRVLKQIPAVDAIGVETVCDIIMYLIGDDCPCNFSPTDEWLPYACEMLDECPEPNDKMGCWKQFIKHYPNRLDYTDWGREEEHNAPD